MLPPLIPVLAWFALLLRYPLRTLAVAMPLLGLILALGIWLQWQEKTTERLLNELSITLTYAPQSCPADLPLQVSIHNNTDRNLISLNWRIAAYRPGERINLVEERYNNPAYSDNSPLVAGQQWQHCLPLPQLRSGYRAVSLKFRAEYRRGQFQ
jgi:hypothetical protein